MVNYSVSLDTVEVDKAFKRLIRKTPELSRRVLSMLSEAVVSRTVVNHLSGPRSMNAGSSQGSLMRKTGTLAKSINYKLSNDYLSKVGTNVKYAAIHEFGGIIKAKNASALHFKIGDKWITVKEVVIPKRPYLAPSIEWVFKNSAQEIMNDELKEWLDKRWKK